MIAALAVAAAVTFSDNSAYTVPLGRGLESCRTWTANKRARAARPGDEEWLWGFLSGADSVAAKSDQRKLVWPSDDSRDFVSFIDRFCDAHPGVPVSHAARVLSRKLAKDGGL